MRVMTVGYTAKGDSFIAGKPGPWSEMRVINNGTLATWDLAPDGKRMAAFATDTTDDKQKPPTHLTFLFNFVDELQRRK
jgi:eukaryotic-like serine/threonine-protein kinase